MNIIPLPMRGKGGEVQTLGEFIQREIQKREMSLSEFARFVGVSHQTISKYMDYRGGTGYPEFGFLVKLSLATGTDLGALASLVEPSASHITPSARLLAERIEKLSEEKRELIDALILGLAIKNTKQVKQ
jgi:transcriptional regulator with XRE-family HTH domain